MTYRPKPGRLRAAALVPVLAASLAFGCGGDDDADTATTTTTAAPPVDAAAFESCILNASIDRGVYEEVEQPDSSVVAVAEEADAEFFEASKADDGIAFFYMPADPATTEELSGSVSTALGELSAALAEDAPKNITLGETTVETEEGVVFGLIPFSAGDEAALIEEMRADVTDCLSEI
jgi:hypothetical protein